MNAKMSHQKLNELIESIPFSARVYFQRRPNWIEDAHPDLFDMYEDWLTTRMENLIALHTGDTRVDVRTRTEGNEITVVKIFNQWGQLLDEQRIDLSDTFDEMGKEIDWRIRSDGMG